MAYRAGVRRGQPVTTALLMEPGLQSRARHPQAEKASLAGLADWALQFTPLVVIDPAPALLLEVEGCLRYFGGLSRLRQHIEDGLQQMNRTARLGGAPTPLGALWLAQAGHDRPIRSLSDLPTMLDGLSIARLPVSVECLDDLAAMGARHLRDLRMLPKDGLARRVGPEVLILLDKAYGLLPDPRAGFEPPDTFDRSVELAYPADNAPALIFVGRRLAEELAGFLLGRGRAVTQLVLYLQHRDLPVTEVPFSLGRPSRQADEILAVLREKLEHLPLAAPVESLRLEATHLEPLASQPLDLFDDTAAQADFPVLLARIRARLGEHAVTQVCPLADHRPEAAWRESPPDEAVPVPKRPRPGWLLSAPKPIPLRDGMPWPDEPLNGLSDVERIESGWWEGQSMSREYHVGEGISGRRYWLFRDRRSGAWFLHGWFG